MKNERRQGVIVATVVIVVISVLGLPFGFIAGLPIVSIVCVIVGSVLTKFERTRQFAVGFLIASAILLFVTAGVCVALIAVVHSSFASRTS